MSRRHPSLRAIARRLFRSWLVSDKVTNEAGAVREVAQRPIRFEPLETRQLMAGDFFNSLTGLPSNEDLYGSTSLNSTSTNGNGNGASLQTMSLTGLQAEGEAAPDLVAFAKALKDRGVIFYGAIWCPFCNEQKQLFQDGAQFLPFVEVTKPDRTPNATGTANNISTYPTWEFPGGTKVTGVQTLQQLSTLANVPIPTSSNPSFTTIANQTLLVGSPLHIPVDAYDPNGNPLTITVSSSNPSLISAEVLQNNKSLKISTEGYGDMVFELFDQEAARATDRVKSLVASGFYNKTTSNQIIFHRVIDNFVIQAGDPTGTGTGGSNLADFDDQFNVNLQHNRTGVLSYAKSSDDTNDSQFFITEGPQRNLDFNHTVFGQLIEGETVREGISQTPVASSSNKPTTNVVISSMSIFEDVENGLIRLKAVGGQSGTSVITVTVTDSEGNSTQQNFNVTIAADTKNSAPFLNDIATPSASVGQPVTFQLSSQDAEGDAVYYDASVAQGSQYAATVNHDTGLVTVTPNSGYTGEMVVTVGVRAATSADTVDTFDTQRLTIAASTASPTSVDLEAASDLGSSSTDNITSAGTMTFVVAGTTAGATVNLRINGTVVGTATATGTSTSITTTNIAALGAATYSVVATQTVNGQQSANSPALQLVYDNVQPVAVATSLVPTSANVGTQLSVDLSHAEEGTALRYSLQNAPAGMIVNATTGLLQWTPTSAQLGAQNFSLILTDTAGNARTQNFAITVNDVALGGISLRIVDTSGNPITSATIGQTFKVQVLVEDLRADVSGVFAAYLDMLYNNALVEPTGSDPIGHGTVYTNTKLGNTATTGVIEELGGVANSNSPLGEGAKVLAEVTMRSKAAGQAIFTTNQPEGSGTEFLIYGRNAAVPFGQVNFGSVALSIGLNFVATNDNLTVAEDSSNNTLTVLSNDTITAGSNAVLSVQSVSTGSAGGTLTVAADGKSIRYSPPANFNGNEVFTYAAVNQDNVSATATVTVTVTPVNDNPAGVPDAVTVNQGSTQNVLNVLANDTADPDTNETLTITAVSGMNKGGTVTISADKKSLLYTPSTSFIGTETFTYTVSDGSLTSTATVTATVKSLIPPPTAVGDTLTMNEEGDTQQVDVLANDTPSQTGETLTVTAATAANGVAGVTSDFKKVTYRPNVNFTGTDLVRYTLRGSLGGVTEGTLTVTVNNVNDAPLAVSDFFEFNSALNPPALQPLNNDQDADGLNTVSITAVTQPASGKGTVAISSNKREIVYSLPSADFEGTLTFTYTITDSAGLTSTATVTLNVVRYQLRDIGFVPDYTGFGDSSIFLGGDGFRIVGRSSDSALRSFNVEDSPITNSNSNSNSDTNSGNFLVARDVLPGTYEFVVPSIPFFQQATERVTINTLPTDSDSLNNRVNLGQVDMRYFDIRDFMGEVVSGGLTVAVSPGVSQKWAIAQGEWKNFSHVDVRLNDAQDKLLIQATKKDQSVASGEIAIGNAKRVERRGVEGDAQLFKIMVSPSALNLNPSTGSSSSNSSSSNNNLLNSQTNSADNLDGEGEGEGFGAPLTTLSTSNSSSNTLRTSSVNATPRDVAFSQVSSQMQVISKAGDAIAEQHAQASSNANTQASGDDLETDLNTNLGAGL